MNIKDFKDVFLACNPEPSPGADKLKAIGPWATAPCVDCGVTIVASVATINRVLDAERTPIGICYACSFQEPWKSYFASGSFMAGVGNKPGQAQAIAAAMRNKPGKPQAN